MAACVGPTVARPLRADNHFCAFIDNPRQHLFTNQPIAGYRAAARTALRSEQRQGIREDQAVLVDIGGMVGPQHGVAPTQAEVLQRAALIT